MIKKSYRKRILCIILTLVLLLTTTGFTQKASAASSKPNITSVTVKSNGLTVKWSSVSKAKTYYVYRSVNGGAYKKVKSTSSTSYSDKAVKSGKKYSYRIKARKTNGSYTSYGKKTSTIYLSRPTLKAGSKAGYMNLTWKAVTGAKYYKVYKWNGTKWKLLKKVTGLSFKDSSVKNTKEYKYKIRAYVNESDYSVLSIESSCVYSHTHSYDYTVDNPATCTEPGSKTGVCACGKTITQVIKSLGHFYDSGAITTAATCTEPGEMTYTCAFCGDTYTEEIPALGHSWNEGTVTKEASCTETGTKTVTCSTCGDVKTEVIPALGHSYDTGKVTTEATCTKEGVKTYTCTRCNEKKTEKIAKTAHTSKAAAKENNVDPTCTKEGSYDTVVRCSVCNTVISSTHATVPALGHSWDAGRVTTEPTCTKEGVKTYTCTRSGCNTTKTEPIDKIAHDWEDIKEDVEVPDSDTGSVGHWDYAAYDGGQNSISGTYIQCKDCLLKIYRAAYDSDEDWLAAGYEHIGVDNQDCTGFDIYINRYNSKQVYTAYNTRTESRVVGRKCKCCGLVEEHDHQWVQDTVDRWTKTSKTGSFAYSEKSTFDADVSLKCTKCGYTVHEYNFATHDEFTDAMSDHNLSVGGTNTLEEVAMVRYEYYLSPGKYVTEDTDGMTCSICGEHKD